MSIPRVREIDSDGGEFGERIAPVKYAAHRRVRREPSARLRQQQIRLPALRAPHARGPQISEHGSRFALAHHAGREIKGEVRQGSAVPGLDH